MTDADTPSKQDIADRSWHAMAPDDALDAFRTDSEAGLSGTEVEKRRQQFGANRLTPRSERTALKRLLSQFNNLFIHLLLAAGVLAAVLGEWLDSGVIFGVVVIIALIGFVQEGRAERALVQVVGADGLIQERQAELLRAIAETLDCPIPPFVRIAKANKRNLCTRSQKMTNLLRNGNVSDPSHVRLRRMLKKPRNASTGSA